MVLVVLCVLAVAVLPAASTRAPAARAAVVRVRIVMCCGSVHGCVELAPDGPECIHGVPPNGGMRPWQICRTCTVTHGSQEIHMLLAWCSQAPTARSSVGTGPGAPAS
ncbi:hypothetical protein GCM10009858_06080 [Terrabacter carboxydivorans]|uniref:Secreted protein n=1 Tax=Terrabacter carboxydivorans TaxID=619730 RepID=A0ABN3KW82_9MICO